MPVVWKYRDAVLTLSLSGDATNHEIQSAIADALVNLEQGTRVGLLCDARENETPLTADDMAWRFELIASLAERGLVSRAALLVRNEQRSLLQLGRTELTKALSSLQCDTFTDESAAVAWLRG